MAFPLHPSPPSFTHPHTHKHTSEASFSIKSQGTGFSGLVFSKKTREREGGEGGEESERETDLPIHTPSFLTFSTQLSSPLLELYLSYLSILSYLSCPICPIHLSYLSCLIRSGLANGKCQCQCHCPYLYFSFNSIHIHTYIQKEGGKGREATRLVGWDVFMGFVCLLCVTAWFCWGGGGEMSWLLV